MSLAPTQALPSLNQSETEGPELGGTETWPPTHGTGPKPEGKTHEAGRRPPGLCPGALAAGCLGLSWSAHGLKGWARKSQTGN